MLFGMEARFAGALDDYLLFGPEESDAKEIFPYLYGSFRAFREGYKKKNMLVIQAHPTRDGMSRPDPGLLDGVEALNLHPGHNSRVGLAARFYDEVGGIAVSGSDFHDPGWAGLGGIWAKTLPSTPEELCAILRSGAYLIDFCGFPVIPRKFEKSRA